MNFLFHLDGEDVLEPIYFLVEIEDYNTLRIWLISVVDIDFTCEIPSDIY